MQSFTTPMMKQYQEIKAKYADCLLFYRMGDFYELFLEDASIGAKVLNITLTSRPKGKDGRIPMAGVPYHAVDPYLAKLVKAGYKVAICEQISLPNKYGIIDREVVRIVTPGTVLDEKALDKKDNNYLVSLLIEGNVLAFSVADISTGQFLTTQITTTTIAQTISDELSRLNPAECILPEKLYNDPEILHMLQGQKGLNVYCFHAWDTYADKANMFLEDHFGVTTLASFGVIDKPLALQTAAALLGYLQYTQRTTLTHIKKISAITTHEHMVLDRSTMINLELFSTIREHDTKGSLLTVIDETTTAMGGRMLKTWIKNPLLTKESITARLDAVSELLEQSDIRLMLREALKAIADIERLLSRLSVGIGNPRDVINVKQSLKKIVDVKKRIGGLEARYLQEIKQKISEDIAEVIQLITTYIVDEPPIDTKNGGIINVGLHKELDALRGKIGGGKDWLLKLEQEERAKTGIGSLKVRFNQVFGFYIEISKANAHLAPAHYMRKQTLVNGERFTTPDLKKQEEIILTAEERSNALEYILFTDILKKVLSYITQLQQAAEAIAALDCILTFAYIAEKSHYIRPLLTESGAITITNGRHPVVERLLENKEFVPNNVLLNANDHQLLLITGPNMAGKSVFIRQVALLVLMAQIGCFVPAEKATISLVDRIFVRSGASDVITSGLSTFMVEMVETAHILHYATDRSLIIMDEIGRGTSTYDGISIAWSVAEYLVTHTTHAPKTLFATHYHELQALEKEYPNNIKNYHMAIEEENGVPIFLHTILPGGASHSFGVAVAKLAGIPEPVIMKALEVLQQLEKRTSTSGEQQPVVDKRASSVLQALDAIDIHEITPLQALNILAALKNTLK